MLSVISVQGSVKNYHWGKLGQDSYIARFRSNGNINHNNDVSKSEKPLAELWFGAHPSGPSSVLIGHQTLKLDEFLAKEPEMVGGVDKYYKYNKKLPFLFKILSIAQPLSLQAHPDKKLAEILHKKDPKNYPDSNHKPELAIALTEFEVLCDFRPANEISHFLKVLAPLRRIVGEENSSRYQKSSMNPESTDHKSHLASSFKALMTCDKATIAKETKSFLTDQSIAGMIDKDLLELVARLDKLYPGDPGVFAPFFLNHLKLQPGQAIFLKANKLHAYLNGECIECMACSDNVVRAGLTTKFRDVDTLMGMLDYTTVLNCKEVILGGIKNKSSPSITTFAPTEEFKVDKIIINQPDDNGEFAIPAVSSGSFVAVFEGRAIAKDFFDGKQTHHLSLGSSGFVPPKVTLNLYRIQAPMTIYRAYC